MFEGIHAFTDDYILSNSCVHSDCLRELDEELLGLGGFNIDGVENFDYIHRYIHMCIHT